MDFCGKLHRILFSLNFPKPSEIECESGQSSSSTTKNHLFSLNVCVCLHIYILDKSRLNIFQIFSLSTNSHLFSADTGGWLASAVGFWYVSVCVCMLKSFIQLVHHCSCGKSFWLAFNLSAVSFHFCCLSLSLSQY